MQPFALRQVLIVLMLVLTAYSQFGITPRMVALRASFVEIDKIPLDDPGRVKFDRLHNWSEKLEGCVLLMGLAVVYAVARQFSD